MHKSGIHIRFGIAVTAAKTGMMQIIQKLTFQKSLKYFQIPLMYGLSFSTTVYKNYVVFLTEFF